MGHGYISNLRPLKTSLFFSLTAYGLCRVARVDGGEDPPAEAHQRARGDGVRGVGQHAAGELNGRQMEISISGGMLRRTKETEMYLVLA